MTSLARNLILFRKIGEIEMGIKSFFADLTGSISFLAHVFPSLPGNDKAFMFYPKIQRATRLVSDLAETWETRLETLLEEMEAAIHSFTSETPYGENDPYVPVLEMVPIRGGNCRLGYDPFTLESPEAIVWEVL